MTANDLPDSVKRQLLDRVREQVGDSQFRAMQSHLGDDGIVNMVLAQIENTTPKKDDAKPTRWWWWLIAIPAFLLLCLIPGFAELMALIGFGVDVHNDSGIVGCGIIVLILIVVAAIALVWWACR